nr:DUF502 domain-containing protein [Desulfobulbaceae bacterium]
MTEPDNKNTSVPGRFTKLKTFFITGVVVITPIGLTFLVVQWFVNRIDSFLYKILPHAYQPDSLFGFHIPGFGLILSFILVISTGFLATNFLGRQAVLYADRIVQRIPLVNSIYTLFKQVMDTTLGKGNKGFRKPVLLEYPRKDVWAIGFMTGVATGEIQDITKHNLLNIFIPTTPNPTSGFYILVPDKDVIPLSMTVEDAFKLIISGGMVSPKVLAPKGNSGAVNI